jgi:predicted kinase
MELVLFVGLQGSGKSTFYRARFGATHEWISKDRMPNRKGKSLRQNRMLEEALRSGRSVVLDNTNPTPADREEAIRLARRYGASVTGYYFASPVHDVLVRNRQRPGKERVPDIAIFATAKRMVKPSLGEGFDRLFCVRLKGSKFEVREWPGGNQECRAE